jgi:hypothetical protein
MVPRVVVVILLFTFETMLFISSTDFTMFWFDSFTVRARVRVVVNFTWVFWRIGMKWIYLCHTRSTSDLPDLSIANAENPHKLLRKRSFCNPRKWRIRIQVVALVEITGAARNGEALKIHDSCGKPRVPLLLLCSSFARHRNGSGRGFGKVCLFT